MNSLKQFSAQALDEEWLDLIREAKEIGLSIEEVKDFLLHKQTI